MNVFILCMCVYVHACAVYCCKLCVTYTDACRRVFVFTLWTHTFLYTVLHVAGHWLVFALSSFVIRVQTCSCLIYQRLNFSRLVAFLLEK